MPTPNKNIWIRNWLQNQIFFSDSDWNKHLTLKHNFSNPILIFLSNSQCWLLCTHLMAWASLLRASPRQQYWWAWSRLGYPTPRLHSSRMLLLICTEMVHKLGSSTEVGCNNNCEEELFASITFDQHLYNSLSRKVVCDSNFCSTVVLCSQMSFSYFFIFNCIKSSMNDNLQLFDLSIA